MSQQDSLQILQTPFSCQNDEHRLFALDPIGVEASGKVFIPLACTNCGTLIVHALAVAPKGTPIQEE